MTGRKEYTHNIITVESIQRRTGPGRGGGGSNTVVISTYSSYSIRIQTLTVQSTHSSRPVKNDMIQETSTRLVSPGSVIALDTKESSESSSLINRREYFTINYKI